MFLSSTWKVLRGHKFLRSFNIQAPIVYIALGPSKYVLRKYADHLDEIYGECLLNLIVKNDPITILEISSETSCRLSAQGSSHSHLSIIQHPRWYTGIEDSDSC